MCIYLILSLLTLHRYFFFKPNPTFNRFNVYLYLAAMQYFIDYVLGEEEDGNDSEADGLHEHLYIDK